MSYRDFNNIFQQLGSEIVFFFAQQKLNIIYELQY